MSLKILGNVLVLAAALSAEVKITADFANASVGSVTKVSELHYRVGVKGQTDQNGRNRQASWYSFRVTGVPKGREVVIDLVDLPGEYNFVGNRGAITADTRPYWKEGKKGTWQEARGDYDATEPKWRIQVRPKKGEFVVAHIPPYTRRELLALRKVVKPEVKDLGRTIEGRPMELWTFDSSGGNEKAPVVWVMFRQHAWEAGTSWVGDGFMRSLPPGVVWKILPWCDPDGVEAGGVRFNRKGYDLNRNWDAPNDPVERPEIVAQKAAMEEWLKAGKKIDLFLTLHNTETGEYLEGPPESKLGRELFAALKEKTKFDPDRDYFSRMKWEGVGRANVIQWLWATHQVPAFLMELRVAESKKLGGRPGAENWREFGAQLAREIAGVVVR